MVDDNYMRILLNYSFFCYFCIPYLTDMHPLEKFRYCPCCGTADFQVATEKSKRCRNCGLELFMNPSAAVAAFITNDKGELLVCRRAKEPAKGTLDLPGGFCDIGETVEEAVRREVREETNITLTDAEYAFSLPNKYMYSGLAIPTLDFFFECKVSSAPDVIHAADDASELLWLSPQKIDPSLFGLDSIRRAVANWKEQQRNGDRNQIAN